ncbi:glycosyltransferase [Novosphingobium sp. FSY-8]|uniref:Glycosyltransferase n=1 Tax=Novosphingobium ovatum TaxID=1908523 RepID=A0ABW9XGH1_9SPHN|nr:glycosyltransferase [Novosphingobium ovatum]NBC37644.1 glycosyltransferase [Novosphingobium ovatum]
MPKISVLIPAYKRPDDLRNTLRNTLEQDYSDYEIVVVDDGTPDDTIEVAVREFPQVRYERTPENLGLIGARNYGARQCRGELILNLDDDSWLTDKDGLARIAEAMDANPQIGIAGLNIGLERRGYLWPVDAPSQALRGYIGCGNVYRRSVIDAVGEYVAEFRRQGEELDRTIRAIDAGFDVRSLPHIRVWHAESPINRKPRDHMAFEAANYLRRELIRAPFVLLPLGIGRALRFVVINHKAINMPLYREEVLGKRVPLRAFVCKYRKPVGIKAYFNWLSRP